MIRVLTFLFIASLFSACNPSTETATKTNQEQGETNADVPDQSGMVPYTENYDDGQVKVLGQKMNGAKVGHWKSFYPDGKIWSEGDYQDGEKNGKFKDYFNSGMLRYKGAYVNDLKQGPWYFYDEMGKIEKKVYYQRGEIDKEK